LCDITSFILLILSFYIPHSFDHLYSLLFVLHLAIDKHF
jgi:hypothetical protein